MAKKVKNWLVHNSIMYYPYKYFGKGCAKCGHKKLIRNFHRDSSLTKSLEYLSVQCMWCYWGKEGYAREVCKDYIWEKTCEKS